MLRDVIDGFKNKHNFSHCAVAEDSTHIPLEECPANYNDIPLLYKYSKQQ